MTKRFFNPFHPLGIILFYSASLLASMETPPPEPKEPLQTIHQIPTKRLSNKILDLGKVHTLYLAPGMVSLIEVPAPISGIRLGDPDSIHYFQPDQPKNEVTLVLKNAKAKPTNLIIRAGKQKYIFDLIPSETIHQDLLEITGAYGGAEMEHQKMTLIHSSQRPLDEKP